MRRVMFSAFVLAFSLIVLSSASTPAGSTFHAHLLSDPHQFNPTAQAKADFWVDGDVVQIRFFLTNLQVFDYGLPAIQIYQNDTRIVLVSRGSFCEPDAPQPLGANKLGENGPTEIWERTVYEGSLTGPLSGGTIADLVQVLESGDCDIRISYCGRDPLVGRIK